MKKIHLNIATILVFCALVFSCKEEQSCSDGVFTPDKEEKLDCGGVCPPCESSEPSYTSLVLADVNASFINFSNYELVKNPDWVLTFSNDTTNISLNFGDGDTLGGRDIFANGSGAVLNGAAYSNLADGYVLFTEINEEESRLTGYFQAKFVSNTDNNDTLRIINGDFEDVKWEE
ncbi:MAG: hypothetical protein WED10_00750 [Brumimicrobium sp.]